MLIIGNDKEYFEDKQFIGNIIWTCNSIFIIQFDKNLKIKQLLIDFAL